MSNQNDQPLISVIVPVYNHAKFIGDTIESVISQTFQNWELLIVDDCSTDKSWEIIQEYEKKDSRIKAFRNEMNKGLIPNWKFLIDTSKGEYLAFLEGDDVFCKENLAEKMLIFEKFPDLGMVYCNFKVIDDDGSILIRNFYKKLGTVTYQNKIISPAEYLCSRMTPFSTYSQIMIRRAVIEVSGYPRSFAPDEKVFLPSDWDFNFLVSTKNRVHFVNDILLKYRKHSNNSSAATPKVAEHLSMILDSYEKEFSKEQAVQAAIKYMRGKLCYFKIIFYLENAQKKDAWNEFFFYAKKFPLNLFRDLSLNSLLFIRLLLPNSVNQYLKRLYFSN
ncbi:MAG: hypothetical protein CO141_03860 [Candidatus Moranbacteria bacterium CG_4_9_14_3_um_filter_42_9]|nr:MAG: hypothetical protein CO141_03860 [Candidatus Moranbacteria bacterium CG_4_9_14_3_um_filter_42_9]